MKNLVVSFLSCFLFLACSEDAELSRAVDPNADALKNENGVSTMDIGPVNQYVWTSLQVPQMDGYPFNAATGRNFILEVNGNVFCGIAGEFEVMYKLNNTTKRWELFEDTHNVYLPFAIGHHYLFSYQSKFYYGLRGPEEERVVNSLDPLTGARQVLAEFPGTPVGNATCFVLGNKGYLMGGSSNGRAINQLWEYDFAANTWTNKGGMPGGARADALAFVVNNKVYFGMGYDIITLNGQIIRRDKTDWIEMVPSGSGLGVIKANFPGVKRINPKGFTINNKIYIGWGTSGPYTYYNDFWEFNPANNTWTQKTGCPAINSETDNINVFASGNAGYLVKGWLNSFWRYSNSSLVPTP